MLTSSTQSFGDEDGMHAPDGRGQARDFPNRGNYIAKAVPATTAVYECKTSLGWSPSRAPMAANYSICIKFWHAAAPRLRRPQKPVVRATLILEPERRTLASKAAVIPSVANGAPFRRGP